MSVEKLAPTEILNKHFDAIEKSNKYFEGLRKKKEDEKNESVKRAFKQGPVPYNPNLAFRAGTKKRLRKRTIKRRRLTRRSKK